jgi:hypothetical protein
MGDRHDVKLDPIITLTTDFGLKDPYVAEMKAAILSICPHATIVDISHGIEKFNIRMGAYVMASAAPFFPKGTIHVTIVDPDVGTKRHPILVQTKQSYFVGPDNGILSLVVRNTDEMKIHRITNRKLMRREVSNTFHGRDIFAPAAAHLANGTSPQEFGPPLRRIVESSFTKIARRKNMLTGEVIHIDDFGNIISNIGENELVLLGLKHVIDLKLKETRARLRLCRAYAEVEPRKSLVIIGSGKLLEVCMNQGNAAEYFGAKIGDKIRLYRS